MQKIADVYLTDGRINVAVQAGPGRMLNFLGAKAEVYHDFEMVTALEMPGAIVVVDPERIDWLPGWMRDVRKVEAEIQMPEGLEIGPAPGYEIRQKTAKKKGWSGAPKEA